MLREFNNNLDKEIKKACEIAPTWYKSLGESHELPLSGDIIHSERLDGYRNKVEFTVGRIYEPAREGVEELWNTEAPICVGFNRGNLVKGIEFVERPDSIKVNSQDSLIIAK